MNQNISLYVVQQDHQMVMSPSGVSKGAIKNRINQLWEFLHSQGESLKFIPGPELHQYYINNDQYEKITTELIRNLRNGNSSKN